MILDFRIKIELTHNLKTETLGIILFLSSAWQYEWQPETLNFKQIKCYAPVPALQ